MRENFICSGFPDERHGPSLALTAIDLTQYALNSFPVPVSPATARAHPSPRQRRGMAGTERERGSQSGRSEGKGCGRN